MLSLSGMYEFGPFRLEVLQRRLYKNGAAIDLSPLRWKLLVFLVESHPRAVPEIDVFDRLWPGETGDMEARLKDVLANLRDKLCGSDNDQNIYIDWLKGHLSLLVNEVRDAGTMQESDQTKRMPPPTVEHAASLPFPVWAEDLGAGIQLEMITLGGGSFLMGSPADRFVEADLPGVTIARLSSRKMRLDINHVDPRGECPAHQVEVSAFAIGRFPVTQKQWQVVMGTNPSSNKGPDNPVEDVSWDDATEFCRILRQRTGKNYRFPTEAEWEYASRGGIYDDYGFTGPEEHLRDHAWYDSGTTHPVGLKQANKYGLHDMQGNVWEWCEDFYAKNYYNISPLTDPIGPRIGRYRVLRGGSFLSQRDECRAAFRFMQGHKIASHTYGFRVVLPSKERRPIENLMFTIGDGTNSPVLLSLGGEKEIEFQWYEPRVTFVISLSKTAPSRSHIGLEAGRYGGLISPQPDRKELVNMAAFVFAEFLRMPWVQEHIGKGNEVKGFEVVREFLLLEGYELRSSAEEIVTVSRRLRSSRLSLPHLARWIDERLKPRVEDNGNGE